MLERVGRRSGAHHRHRSGQAAAAQSDGGEIHAVSHGSRNDDRLGRLRDDPRQGARARRLRGIQGAPPRQPGSAASTAGSASRACWSMRAACRSKATSLSFPGGQSLVLGLNVQSTGQGHATVFPPMVAERLGIATEQVEHRHGDSAMEIAGYASVGSRSAMTVSHALVKTIEATAEQGQVDRGAVAGGVRGRHRLPLRPFRSRGNRPPDLPVRSRGARRRHGQARRDSGKPRHQGQCRDAAHLSQRLPHRGSRDRSGNRRARRSTATPRSTIAAPCSIT